MMIHKAAFLPPEDLTKLVLEVAAGGVEVVQVRQDAAFSRGTFGRVHARLHYDTQPGNRWDWIACQCWFFYISTHQSQWQNKISTKTGETSKNSRHKTQRLVTGRHGRRYWKSSICSCFQERSRDVEEPLVSWLQVTGRLTHLQCSEGSTAVMCSGFFDKRPAAAFCKSFRWFTSCGIQSAGKH